MVKKLLSLSIVLFLLLTPQAYASERLLDIQTNDYYRTVKHVLTSDNENFQAECSELSRGGLPTTQIFFVYKDGNTMEVFIGEDKDGYVQFVGMVVQNTSLARMGLGTLLASAGITEEEYNNRKEIISNETRTLNKIWSSKLNKYVILEGQISKKNGAIFTITTES